MKNKILFIIILLALAICVEAKPKKSKYKNPYWHMVKRSHGAKYIGYGTGWPWTNNCVGVNHNQLIKESTMKRYHYARQNKKGN